MNSRTIRITKSCEFGEPGDLLNPDPRDIAALLVEIRGVAVYEDQTPDVLPKDSSAEQPRPQQRRPRKR